MRSKNKPRQTSAQSEHAAKVAACDCVVCDAPGPSEVHHIKQKSFWYCVPLCVDCHRGPILGVHGQKRAWIFAKMDEMDALAKTIQRISNELA